MAYAYPSVGALDYYPCRYGTSRLLFRGPRRDLTKAYCAVLGGTETYGKFVPHPFPALVEVDTGIPMVNLGCVNAGLDVYSGEPVLMDLALKAQMTVVQVTGAQNMSNRYYSVHPRRNDRFVRASPLLRTIFREVDFTEFHFTRHLMQTLQAVSPEKFEVVADELRAAWVARMIGLLTRIPGKTVMLWLGNDAPLPPGQRADLARDPLLIDVEMIRAVRPYVTEYVEVISSPMARAEGLNGMAYGPMEQLAALGLPGPLVHREVANALGPVINRLF